MKTRTFYGECKQKQKNNSKTEATYDRRVAVATERADGDDLGGRSRWLCGIDVDGENAEVSLRFGTTVDGIHDAVRASIEMAKPNRINQKGLFLSRQW